MRRMLIILLGCVPWLAQADDTAFRPLSESLVAAVAHRDFVKFVKCFPENTEFLEHLRVAERSGKSITLDEVNRKLEERHVLLSKNFAEVLKQVEEQLDFDSRNIATLSTIGPRHEGKQMNLLKIELVDKNGKKLVLKVDDLILVGNRWLIADRVTAQTE